MDQNKEEIEDPDKHYLGNIWGWKFSFIGLGLILFLLTIAIYRANKMGVKLHEMEDKENPVELFH